MIAEICYRVDKLILRELEKAIKEKARIYEVNLKDDFTFKEQRKVMVALKLVNLSEQTISSRRQSPEEIVGNCRHLTSETRMSEEKQASKDSQ